MLNEIMKLKTEAHEGICSIVTSGIYKVVRGNGLEVDNGVTFDYIKGGGFEVDYQLYRVDSEGETIMFTSIDGIDINGNGKDSSEMSFDELCGDLEAHYNIMKDLAIDREEWRKVKVYKELEDLFRSCKIWYLAG